MERLTLFNLRRRSRSVEPQTQTILDQLETEQKVRKAYYEKLSQWKDEALQLFKVHHINYLTRKLVNLPTSFESLDASQPWLAYWMIHSLRLLNFTISDEMKQQLIRFLASTQHVDGGFGGGPYQFPHLAPTYGAVSCLVLLCRADALQVIDRVKLANWFRELHQPDGSLLMHIGGESDVRGAYCAIAVAKLTGLLDKHPDLFSGTAEWVARCQTYEGGFGAQPGIEAHGGYTFCAVAALCLLGRADLINIPRLLHWVAHRQMASEGGFQGRTNKLVDSCYSFWQGAVFPIVEELCSLNNDPALLENETLFNSAAVQEYILLCCQKVSYTRAGLSVPSTLPSDAEKATHGFRGIDMNSWNVDSGGGGLIDKPGKYPDCYHTCYALSGLSIAQHAPRPRPIPPPEVGKTDGSEQKSRHLHLVGSPNPAPAVDPLCAELADLDPLLNVLHDGLAFTLTYFSRLDDGLLPAEAERCAIEAMERYNAPAHPALVCRTDSGDCTTTVHEIGDTNTDTLGPRCS
ncbi:Farnesyltransferase subunit beta [Fasciola gigantica]|uniref:Protein farnesyltransferase subunit beta n=1 Tax=Fasciola gigantica TaxID=46835 RepID=A0A504Z811_FASGI|nr:Farnesyltransferase subunit beta [Fasciola gigantica]